MRHCVRRERYALILEMKITNRMFFVFCNTFKVEFYSIDHLTISVEAFWVSPILFTIYVFFLLLFYRTLYFHSSTWSRSTHSHKITQTTYTNKIYLVRDIMPHSIHTELSHLERNHRFHSTLGYCAYMHRHSAQKELLDLRATKLNMIL